VLVVDDEPLVRRVLRLLLAEHHEVADVGSVAEALAVLAADRYDVVVSDLMMPGMSGADLFEAVRRAYPGLERRIVFTTGGPCVPGLAAFLQSVPNATVAKPFEEAQLLTAITAAVLPVDPAIEQPPRGG
jgi:CheY-like chemotaxis protein